MNTFSKINKLQIVILAFFIIFSVTTSLFAGTASLTWTAPTANSDGSALTDLAGYKIYYGTASGNYTQQVDAGNATSYTLTLADGASYYFTITAYDASGNESGYSNEASKTIAVPDDNTPPSDIQNFTATPGDKEAILSWADPTDPDFVGVRIKYRTDGQYPVDADDGVLLGDFTGGSGESHSAVHSGLQNDLTYYYSAFSYDAVGNFTHTVHAIATPSAGIINTSQGGAPGAGGGGGCFIATAAYGSYLDPHVMVLRGFRDNYLLTNAPGKVFVAFYYRVSPPVADFIREHDGLRMTTRFMLTPIIYGVKYLDYLLVVLTILLGGSYVVRNRHRLFI